MCTLCEKDIFDINNDLVAKRITFKHNDTKNALTVFASRPYQGIVKTVILALKYQRDPHMADLIIRVFQPDPAYFQHAILCPVPLHPRRLLTRTYNQSTEIAKILAARSTGAQVLHLLKRVRATPPQGKKSPQQRTSNVANCFQINRKYVDRMAGRKIIVIDDVCTSGATLVECTKVLYEHAGATHVQAYVLALAFKKIGSGADSGGVDSTLISNPNEHAK